MVNNRLLLGLIAFSISSGISLITTRNIGNAVLTGLTTLPAVYIASGVVNRRSVLRAENRMEALNYHIYALQQRRMEAYQEFTDMLAEKEQVAAALNSMQMQLHQLQLPGSTAIVPRPAVSWNLSDAAAMEAPAYDLPTEIQTPGQRQALGQMLSEAAATKRKIETSLQFLQKELSQLKDQAVEHRQTRDRLTEEITQLTDQKQQLETDAATLRAEVQDLEHCRTELDRFIAYAETKKQELDTGKHPLQIALSQLQTEINRLHEEVRVLESQVSDRQTQKAALDEEILAAEQIAVQSTPPAKPDKGGGSAARSQPSRSAGHSPSSSKKSGATHSAVENPLRQVVHSLTSVALPNLPKPQVDPPSLEPQPADLPAEWTELMLQLPEYEVHVLQAIAEQANPAPAIKRIAEASLTMPELLIDSINERALDTVGDLIIEPRSGQGAAIAPEHLQRVKKLIKTYESLV